MSAIRRIGRLRYANGGGQRVLQRERERVSKWGRGSEWRETKISPYFYTTQFKAA
jgi:hypothetical protein